MTKEKDEPGHWLKTDAVNSALDALKAALHATATADPGTAIAGVAVIVLRQDGATGVWRHGPKDDPATLFPMLEGLAGAFGAVTEYGCDDDDGTAEAAPGRGLH